MKMSLKRHIDLFKQMPIFFFFKKLLNLAGVMRAKIYVKNNLSSVKYLEKFKSYRF